MLRRRMLQTGVAIGMVAVSLLGLGSAANAAPANFTAAAVHAGGAGKLAVEAVGGLSWGNRSVTLTGVKFYAGPGECGYFHASGWQGGTFIARRYFPASGTYCGGAGGQWITIGTFTLDASTVPGGITKVVVVAVDTTHQITGDTTCFRSEALCL